MLKDIGKLIVVGIIALIIVFAAPAIIAAILYYGVPFVTGYDNLGYWQYFVAIVLVIVVARFVLGIGGKPERGG